MAILSKQPNLDNVPLQELVANNVEGVDVDALKCKGLLKSSMGSITQIYSLTQGEQTRISVRL
jgi:hypothetical protein